MQLDFNAQKAALASAEGGLACCHQNKPVVVLEKPKSLRRIADLLQKLSLSIPLSLVILSDKLSIPV